MVQGQKVNYNLKQLMKKVWKKPDLSTSTRVPASGEYPQEDDCTDVLLRVQHPSAEPAATGHPPQPYLLGIRPMVPKETKVVGAWRCWQQERAPLP